MPAPMIRACRCPTANRLQLSGSAFPRGRVPAGRPAGTDGHEKESQMEVIEVIGGVLLALCLLMTVALAAIPGAKAVRAGGWCDRFRAVSWRRWLSRSCCSAAAVSWHEESNRNSSGARSGVPLAVSAVGSEASTSTYCGLAGYDVTRGGYEMSYSGARASGMNCASVRYAMRFFRRKAWQNQFSWQHMPRAFWDGYVTWRCQVGRGHRVRCAEYTTGTSYSFRAYVW